MTSEDFQGKYDRLCTRVYKAIVEKFKEVGEKNVGNLDVATTISGGPLGSFLVEGIGWDGKDYFVRTDMWNVKISTEMPLKDLITILKFLEIDDSNK